MRKASRLWRRLRGGRSDKTQVADDATGDSSNLNSDSQESALPVAVHSDALDPLLAPERDDRDTAETMWLDAYKKLEEGQETREMVIAYEELLGQQLNGLGKMVEIDVDAPNAFSGCPNPEEKISTMRRVTEATLEKASRHSESKQKFVKAAKVISTISSSIIKPMLQTEAVASLAWAGVCVALEELYYNLLIYEMQCVCYCYRDSHVKKTLQALVTLDDWKGRLTSIKELESRIQLDVSQFGHVQIQDDLDNIAQNAERMFTGIDHYLQRLLENQEQTFSVQETIRLQELVGQFSTSDYNKQMRLNPTRIPGTYPGCGKSTLARCLIEEVLPQQKSTGKLLYFFFKDTNEQKRLSTAICAVLHQMLLDDHTLVSKVEDRIKQAGEKVTEHTSILWKLFSQACERCSESIICVLDAIDECDPGDSPELIRNIQDLVKSELRIRFLITTRGYPRLLNQFNAYESGLIYLDGDGKNEKDAIQEEISLVLDYRLEELSKIKKLDQQPERKTAIEEALRSKGSKQRTYLWLKLVFDILGRIPWKSDSDWKKVINSPPQDVNDAYATLLQKVPEEEKSYVKILLHLVVAARRPLTLREMAIAIVVRDNPGAIDEKSLGLQSDTEFKNWILHTCGFFVTIYNNELYFIHQTAKEFLVNYGRDASWPQVLDWFSPVTDQIAHKSMAESCISYISLKKFRYRRFQERARAFEYPELRKADWNRAEERNCLFRDHGFLEYTVNFWTDHFELCQNFKGFDCEDVEEAFTSHYIALFVPDGTNAPGWMCLHPWSFQNDSHHVLEEVQSLFGNYNLSYTALHSDHCRLLKYSQCQNAQASNTLLHTAAKLNASNCVRYLILNGAEIDAQDDSGNTALCLATRGSAMTSATTLLDYNADVNLGKTTDQLPLSHVLKQLQTLRHEPFELLRKIVDHGADLNNTFMKGTRLWRPLAWISCIVWDSMVPYNLDSSSTLSLDEWVIGKSSASEINSVPDLFLNLDLSSEEHFVAAYNNSLTKFFLDHGGNIDDTFPYASENNDHAVPMTALEHACVFATIEEPTHTFWNALSLLYSGADGSINTETTHSALDRLLFPEPYEAEHYFDLTSTLRGKDRCQILATLLLEQGPTSGYINRRFASKAMQTRLHMVANGVKFLQMKMELLLSHGAYVDCRDDNEKTPMHYLVSRGWWGSEECAALKLLIDKDADLEARDSLGRTPMHYVEDSTALDILVENGADIEARDYQGNTPLLAILARGEDYNGSKLIQSLLTISSDPTVSNCAGETPMHIAATLGLIASLAHLLDDGGDLEVTDKAGDTPLQAALNHQSLETAVCLLERGAIAKPLMERGFDIEQRDGHTGATLLAFASGYHAHDIVRTLLRRGANPNALPKVGLADVESRWTHDAAITIDLLLKHGADINAKSSVGMTPLHVACERGNEEGVHFLLQRGARVNLTNWDDESALYFACTDWQPSPTLLQTLLLHGETLGSGCYDEPELYSMAEAWEYAADDPNGNEYEDSDYSSHSSCQKTDSDTINDYTTGLNHISCCPCRQCCHERQACATAQILMDAGAWTQLRDYKQKVDSPVEKARENGWADLAMLLKEAAVPNWRRAWLPPNTRRWSLPAEKSARLDLDHSDDDSSNGMAGL
ncbi:hypothetical protein J7T55_005381 [Diaporthe amygdali]|uniref:uncharacterized protein n=1 Tax=Phomopsis amygdali TaxID=1214568 RepID=UPI0022FF1B6E|nr:uncharacterized protein J7T55_005381 [Diaporthe amygdali]KAJ0108404.1 hypothetical protein J7T55_005381 [Diaporthe amygdali]